MYILKIIQLMKMLIYIWLKWRSTSSHINYLRQGPKLLSTKYKYMQ